MRETNGCGAELRVMGIFCILYKDNSVTLTSMDAQFECLHELQVSEKRKKSENHTE